MLFASVSNHRWMMMKVSGMISVMKIHHQCVMARTSPSGLTKTVLRKDCGRCVCQWFCARGGGGK